MWQMATPTVKPASRMGNRLMLSALETASAFGRYVTVR